MKSIVLKIDPYINSLQVLDIQITMKNLIKINENEMLDPKVLN